MKVMAQTHTQDAMNGLQSDRRVPEALRANLSNAEFVQIVGECGRLRAEVARLREALQNLIPDAAAAAAFNREQGFYDVAAERRGRINAARATLSE